MARPQSKHIIIAHPMDSFHPAGGGGIRYLMNLLQMLVSQTWSVTVIGVRAGTPPHNPQWTQIALSPQIAHWTGWVGYLLNLYLRLPFLRLPPKAVIVTHRMDCMLAFVLFRPSCPTVMISAAPAHYLRLNFPRLFALFGWLYRLAERVCVYGCDAIVPQDPVTQAYYRQHYPGAEVLACVPTSVDLALMRKQPQSTAREGFGLTFEARIVLFMGRLAPVKNLPFLLRAFARVARRVPQAQLWIVGHGESEAALKSLASQQPETVVFVGEVPPTQVSRYYAVADVLALCSMEEGSPTVIKESLACGIPVVSTDVGDAHEVLSVSPELGRVVPASEEAFAEALIDYLTRTSDDEAIRDRRSWAVRKYGIEETGQRLMSIIESAQARRINSGLT